MPRFRLEGNDAQGLRGDLPYLIPGEGEARSCRDDHNEQK
jgi:hypothetical protein